MGFFYLVNIKKCQILIFFHLVILMKIYVFSISTFNIISFNQNKIVSLNKNSLKKKIFAEFKKTERFITVLY